MTSIHLVSHWFDSTRVWTHDLPQATPVLYRFGYRARWRTCDNKHSWWVYSAAPLANKAAGTITWYCTLSHYPDTELTNTCSITLMLGNQVARTLTRYPAQLPYPDTERTIPCPILLKPSTRLGSEQCHGDGDIAQLVKAQGWWAWEQGCESQ